MKRAAFTLVELLAVVAVTALLAALLLPAAGRALYATRSAGCESNLRQIDVAAKLYAADHDGTLIYDVLGTNGVNGTWENGLNPYLPGTKLAAVGQRPTGVFACGESRKMVSNPSKSDYAHNYWLNTPETSTQPKYKLVQMVPAARILAFADGSARYFNEATPAIAFRHSGKAHLLFFDGHVESATTNDLVLTGGKPPLLPQ